MKKLNLFLTAIAMLYGTQNLPAMNQANLNVLYYPNDIVEPLATEKQNTYNFFTHNNSQALWVGAQKIQTNLISNITCKYAFIFASNIEIQAVNGIPDLEYIHISSDQPISIGEYAFLNCPNLQTIEIHGKLQNVSSKTFYKNVNDLLPLDSRFVIYSRPDDETFNLARKLPAWSNSLEWIYNDRRGNVRITLTRLLQLRESARLYNSFNILL